MPDILATVAAAGLLLPSAYVAVLLAPEARSGLFSRVVIGFAAYFGTAWLIPTIAVYTEKKGLCGRDLGKRYIPALRDKTVPEALGIVSALAFLVCVILSQCVDADSAQSQANYNSALASVCFMVLLGFMDDVLDLPWRAKLILPTIASLPLLVTYSGSTSVVVPVPLRTLFVDHIASKGSAIATLTTFGTLIDSIPFVTVDTAAQGAILELGLFYLVYMGVLSVFCTNAINIYAGINGLEAGQSYVIGCAMLFYCVLQVHLGSEDSAKYEFAATLILPFLGATLGLLKHNWHPSAVFVGDTYCYFAGMTFAVAGIHGHFTKPLWLFFIPQLCNFVYSVPQLFKLVPCPRHRLPDVLENPDFAKGDPKGGPKGQAVSFMVPSTFEVKPGAHAWLKALHGLPPSATKLPNFTLINLVLGWLGPTTERSLCLVLLALQVLSCGLALLFRFSRAASYLFDG